MKKHIEIELTKEIWKIIKETNKEVNEEITYLSDQEHYGVADKWVENPPDKKGDCDEYAVTKKKRLKEKEIPTYLACCWTETKRYHLVCVIKTNIGDFVLDNRYPFVLDYDELPYEWDKIEGEGEVWYEIID